MKTNGGSDFWNISAQEAGSGIIYAATVKAVNEISEFLATKGYSVAPLPRPPEGIGTSGDTRPLRQGRDSSLRSDQCVLAWEFTNLI